MNSSIPSILLIDLPVFPKGVVSLGMPVLAAYLKTRMNVAYLDLNEIKWPNSDYVKHADGFDYVGLKVSSQNLDHAIEVTSKLKKEQDGLKVIWGGEFPSLLPPIALEYADCIVTKRVEGCIEELLEGLLSKELKQKYEGSSDFSRGIQPPSFELVKNSNYYSFMGMPMETSTGCDRFCRFCMVHTMQPGMKFKTKEQLRQELKNLSGEFLNVVDYNIGVSKDHLLTICNEIQRSEVTGWMGEMCLETLDDDAVLKALTDSRCKMIYCGLESLSEVGLKSVNKHRTNNPLEYRRIIRKAQSHGVNVASGFIIGLDGADQTSFDEMMNFYNEVGIEYVKLTFLTYNPGTYFYDAMKRSGSYSTTDLTKFDGNHLTYVADGLDQDLMYQLSTQFIKKHYSIVSVVKRSGRAHKVWTRRLEYILFNFCYRETYFDWLEYSVLKTDSSGIRTLMNRAFRKSVKIRIAESLLRRLRLFTFKRQCSIVR